MMRRLPLTAAIFTATLALFGSGCGYLKARDELNKGVASMRGAKFKDAAERRFLVEQLRACGWNISKTAEVIDTPRSNLYKKLEQYRISQETDG